ncbi:MAG TPA: hypothetical protein VM100_08845 [Longimicrobiales bacterium]|nr:hypothetical protein [Longimicrobiales bacterium]
MAVTKRAAAFAAVFALLQASALLAQAPPAGGTAPPPTPAGAVPVPKKPVPEPKLVFDREVFNYGGSDRRDPFKALLGKESSGPLFEDLKLKGVIFSADPRLSIVLIMDGSKKMYRLHRGDVIGNARVVDIQPLIVRFTVENFGNLRNEVLELRRGAADAAGVGNSQTVPANEPIANRARNAAEAKKMLDSLAAAQRAKTQAQPTTTTNNELELPFLQEAHR